MNINIQDKFIKTLVEILKRNKNKFTMKFSQTSVKGLFYKDLAIVIDSDSHMFVYRNIGPKLTETVSKHGLFMSSSSPYPEVLDECSKYELLTFKELNNIQEMELNYILDSIVYSEMLKKIEHLQENHEDLK